MKISVSLEADDVSFLDEYAQAHGSPSRSAAVAAAVRALRESSLQGAYEQAFAEWADDDANAAWDNVVSDGIVNHERGDG